MQLQARFLRRITREHVYTAIGVLLITVIGVCGVIIVIALLRDYGPGTRPTYPTTRFSVTTVWPTPDRFTPDRPSPYYKNCAEAHADNRWDIPRGDPAYRRALDRDGNGIACESRKSRRGSK